MATTRTTRKRPTTTTRRVPGEERLLLTTRTRAQHQQHQQQSQAETKLDQHQDDQARQRRRRSTRSNYSALPAATANKYAHVADTATEPSTRPQRRNSARMKRPLEVITPNPDPTKVKRSRIAVEIKSLSRFEPPSPPRTIVVRAAPPPSSTADVTTQQNKPPPSLAPTPTAATTAAAPIAIAAEPAPQPKTDPKLLTTHQKKVVNGIRQELSRLNPNAADAGLSKEPGRKLRSQEATRFKSELSAYFPDYDEVIGNDAKEHHTLNVETPILVVDSGASPHHNARSLHPRQAAAAAAKHLSRLKSNNNSRHQRGSWTSNSDKYNVKSYGDELYTNLYEAQQINLPTLELRRDGEDPLPDSLYETAHRRAERQEKSIRNTEKGRAQHEKDQIIRLLGELEGQDWLRTMGVNGVTESRKKTFEAARDHFIRGCKAILAKFKRWTEEEKRRKLERDRIAAEESSSSAQETEEGEEDEEDEEQEVEHEAEGSEIADSQEDEDMSDMASGHRDNGDESDGDPPDSSDVDAHIAKQLYEEASARAGRASSVSHKRFRREPSLSPIPQPPREFRSFFDKRHDRDAALSKVRRGRRSVQAWGHDVPETEEEDFELSIEYRDEEMMQTRERRKRRDRRGGKR